MKKILITSLAIMLGSILPSYALETTGTITTQTTGLSITLPCNPVSISNGSVDANTCAITCNANYSLSGLTCNLNSTGGGGGGGGGGSSPSSVVPTATGSTTNTGTVSSTGSTTVIPSETEENVIEVGSNLNSGVSGEDEADTIKNEGSCSFGAFTTIYGDNDTSWAKSYIRDLTKRGIINGVQTENDTGVIMFEPERLVTRAEFLKIAMKSFCYDYSALGGVESFTDVENGSWIAQLTELAGSMGVIDISNSAFRPNEAISKIEATKIILKIGETRSTKFKVDETISTSVFMDVTIPWMMKYASKAFELDIMTGNAGKFEPSSIIDRAQAAKIAVRTMNAQ